MAAPLFGLCKDYSRRSCDPKKPQQGGGLFELVNATTLLGRPEDVCRPTRKNETTILLVTTSPSEWCCHDYGLHDLGCINATSKAWHALSLTLRVTTVLPDLSTTLSGLRWQHFFHFLNSACPEPCFRSSTGQTHTYV